MAAENGKRKVRNRLLIAGSLATLLVLIIFSQAAFNLKFLRPESVTQTFVLASLSGLIFLALIVLIYVLGRTLVKLYLERQEGVAGSRFRSKMVLGALVLSLAPVVAMFLFAYGLMNRSIDKWFSQPIEQVHGRTTAVASMLSSYAGQNAQALARMMASTPEARQAYATGHFEILATEFREHELSLQGGFVLAFHRNQLRLSLGAPLTWDQMRPLMPDWGDLEYKPRQYLLGSREYIVAAARVPGSHADDAASVAVGIPLPERYGDALRQLDHSEQQYQELRRSNKLIRQTYMQALLLITLMVLFAAMWSALALSKIVTHPVMALLEGMQAIAAGKLDYRVGMAAGDELGQLVDSFNSMASEIEHNRHELEEANLRLEERRLHTETILESIPTGVLTLDGSGQVTRVNAALIRMFYLTELSQSGAQSGLRLNDLFSAERSPGVADDIWRMVRKADRMGFTTASLEIPTARGTLESGVTVASMTGPRQARRLGYVIVFEDLSELLKAQQQVAWSEVARRVAHEIKNPLTPIALSAERIKRHIARIEGQTNSHAVIASCADLIGNSCETVRRLVDEFSALARFPQSQPQPNELNPIVENALTMFDGRLEGVELKVELGANLPRVMADPEAMKRVVANLVDNAAESLQQSLVREIHVATTLLETRDAVELEISDTGCGVSSEAKEKLFLPYFSTKARGTGLGLAIVARIVDEHRGTIRVEENSPMGTRFVIELPVAAETDGSTANTPS